MKNMRFRYLFGLLLLLGWTTIFTQNTSTPIVPTAPGSSTLGFGIAQQLQEGDLAMRNARWEEAVDIYEQVTLQWPNWAPAHVKLAMVKLRMGRETEAQRHLQVAQRISATSVHLFSEDSFGGRLDLLLGTAIEEENAVDTPMAAVHAYKRSGQFTQAEIELESLWSNGLISDADFAFHNGNLHLLRGNYDRAIEAYDRALVFAAGDATVRHHRGLAKILRYDFNNGCGDLITAGRDGYTPALEQWADLCTF